MARPQTVDEETLLARLAEVFRDVGYQAASLSQLSKAAGLQRASLYHRFPNGKEQMAAEVLDDALNCFSQSVIAPLINEGAPQKRLAKAASGLDAFYNGGRRACLLNLFSAPLHQEGPFSMAISSAFAALIEGFERLARDAGQSPGAARKRAERVVMLLQGSLVLSRGLGNDAPFKNFLANIRHELIGDRG